MVSSSIAMMPQRENTGVSEALTRVRMCRHRGGFIGSANAPPRMTLSGSYVCFPKSVTAGARCYTSPAVRSLAEESMSRTIVCMFPDLEEGPQLVVPSFSGICTACWSEVSAPSSTVGLETSWRRSEHQALLSGRWRVYGTIRRPGGGRTAGRG